MAKVDTSHQPVLTLHCCGGKQAERCIDGGEHDMSVWKTLTNGASLACRKCGITAMDLDLTRLP